MTGCSRLQPLAIAGGVVLLAFSGERNLLMTLGGHSLCFFLIAMACHGELARNAPGGALSDGFLCRALFRRHGGRIVRGPARAVHFFVDRRISDLARVVRALSSARIAERARCRWLWLLAVVAALALVALAYQTGSVTKFWKPTGSGS